MSPAERCELLCVKLEKVRKLCSQNLCKMFSLWLYMAHYIIEVSVINLMLNDVILWSRD